MMSGEAPPDHVRQQMSRYLAEESTFLDRYFYLDPGVFDVDMRLLLPDSWVFAGDTSELANHGDFLTTEAGDEPVIVVRDPDGELRAFVNSCPHRGSILYEGRGNHGKQLRCPYHGWSFKPDGSLAGVPCLQRFAEPSALDAITLRSVRLSTWGRFIFVNTGGTAPALTDCLERGPELLAPYRLEEAVYLGRSADRFDVNWKVFSDINLDGYHIPTVHRKTIARDFRIRDITMAEGVRFTSTAVFPLQDRHLEGVRVRADIASSLQSASVTFVMYPSFILSALPDGSFFVTWCTPAGVSSTSVGVITYGPAPEYGGTAARDPEQEKLALKQLAQVREEDYQACLRTARGMRSRYYRPGPVNDLEVQAASFHRWMRERYRQLVAPAMQSALEKGA